VKGAWNVGGLVGYGNELTISNCFSACEVTGLNNVGGIIGNIGDVSKFINTYASGAVFGKGKVGGFVGCAESVYKVELENCHTTGNVTADGDYVGGFIGFIDTVSIVAIKNCYATGTIVTSGGYAGGLVGYIAANNQRFDNCYAIGNVTANGDYAGGFAGYFQRYFQYPYPEINAYVMYRCFASGNVAGRDNVGGFLGYYKDGGDIMAFYNTAGTQSCYATGSVSGRNIVGGFVGDNDGGLFRMVYTAGQVSAYGEFAGAFVGKHGATAYRDQSGAIRYN
jgi:hypothetical protein